MPEWLKAHSQLEYLHRPEYVETVLHVSGCATNKKFQTYSGVWCCSVSYPQRLSAHRFCVLCLQSTTYVKQLNDYEEAVMMKRYEAMTDAELADLAEEIEAQKKESESK